MRYAFLVVAFVVLPALALAEEPEEPEEPARRPAKVLTLGIISAHAFDAIATELYFSDVACRKCHEANPLARPFVGHPASLVAYKTAGVAFQIWLVHKLHRRHPTAAKVLGWINIVGPTTIGVVNLAGR